MKRLLLLSFFVLLSISLFCETITLGTGEWAPFVSESLPNYGFSSELIRAAFAAEGVDVEIKFTPWKRCEDDLKNNRVTAIYPYSYTDERERAYHTSDALFNIENRVFYLKDRNIQYENLQDLNRYKVGALAGYATTKMLQDKKISVDISQKLEHVIKKILAERTDVYVGVDIVVWNYLQKNFPKDVDKFEMKKEPISSELNGVLFNKDNPDSKKYAEIFNRGLAKIKANGTFKKIIDAHNIKMIIPE